MNPATQADPESTLLLEQYVEHLRSRRSSPHTISNYQRDLHQLLTLASANAPGQAITTLSEAHIRRFAASLHGRGLGPRSIARVLSAWRGFFNWLARHDRIAVNPVIGVRAPRAPQRLPKALAIDQAVALASAREGDQPENLRDAALCELLYSSGLRVSELAGLDVAPLKTGQYQSRGWVDFSSAEVTVTGKGDKQRQVPVGSAALVALRAWLDIRPQWLQADIEEGQHALFISPRGRRMTVRAIQLRIKALAQRLGIPAKVHPHVLRHSFASHLLQSSGDLRAVQELLGHASIASTQIYTSLDFQRLAEVYDAAHPRARRNTIDPPTTIKRVAKPTTLASQRARGRKTDSSG